MKIFCVGRNYGAHAKELGNSIPDNPVIFTKPETAVLKNNAPFYHPDFSQDIHHEVELVIRINKNGKKIHESFARNYFNEICLGIDFTARDIQNELKSKGLPWDLAKGFDGSAPVSECLSMDNMNPSTGISFSLRKNGAVVQEGNSRDMIFSFEKIVSFVSRYFTLKKGDLIFTGTPAGVGKVEIGDKLEGLIGNKLMLSCEIK